MYPSRPPATPKTRSLSLTIWFVLYSVLFSEHQAKWFIFCHECDVAWCCAAPVVKPVGVTGLLEMVFQDTPSDSIIFFSCFFHPKRANRPRWHEFASHNSHGLHVLKPLIAAGLREGHSWPQLLEVQISSWGVGWCLQMFAGSRLFWWQISWFILLGSSCSNSITFIWIFM